MNKTDDLEYKYYSIARHESMSKRRICIFPLKELRYGNLIDIRLIYIRLALENKETQSVDEIFIQSNRWHCGEIFDFTNPMLYMSKKYLKYHSKSKHKSSTSLRNGKHKNKNTKKEEEEENKQTTTKSKTQTKLPIEAIDEYTAETLIYGDKLENEQERIFTGQIPVIMDITHIFTPQNRAKYGLLHEPTDYLNVFEDRENYPNIYFLQFYTHPDNAYECAVFGTRTSTREQDKTAHRRMFNVGLNDLYDELVSSNPQLQRIDSIESEHLIPSDDSSVAEDYKDNNNESPEIVSMSGESESLDTSSSESSDDEADIDDNDDDDDNSSEESQELETIKSLENSKSLNTVESQLQRNQSKSKNKNQNETKLHRAGSDSKMAFIPSKSVSISQQKQKMKQTQQQQQQKQRMEKSVDSIDSNNSNNRTIRHASSSTDLAIKCDMIPISDDLNDGPGFNISSSSSDSEATDSNRRHLRRLTRDMGGMLPMARRPSEVLSKEDEMKYKNNINNANDISPFTAKYGKWGQKPMPMIPRSQSHATHLSQRNNISTNITNDENGPDSLQVTLSAGSTSKTKSDHETKSTATAKKRQSRVKEKQQIQRYQIQQQRKKKNTDQFVIDFHHFIIKNIIKQAKLKSILKRKRLFEVIAMAQMRKIQVLIKSI